MNMLSDTAELGSLLQRYFCSYLINQRRVSSNTVAAYRDTFRLLLSFLAKNQRTGVASLALADLHHDNILSFLQDIEQKRHNSIRTRNVRLAAIRSFLNYAAVECPDALFDIQKSLTIPPKRRDRHLVQCLDKEEISALLNAPDLNTWSGLRDHILFLVLYNTGARVSELIHVQRQDIDLQSQNAIHLHGKGRKERVIPLWPHTVIELKQWGSHFDKAADAPVFPNRFGMAITRSGVQQRLRCAQLVAATNCPSLKTRKISPHTIRHTTALHLLQSGVDLSVIALWLGHEQIDTTHQYMEADLEIKKAALDTLTPVNTKPRRSRLKQSEKVLAFLESL